MEPWEDQAACPGGPAGPLQELCFCALLPHGLHPGPLLPSMVGPHTPRGRTEVSLSPLPPGPTPARGEDLAGLPLSRQEVVGEVQTVQERKTTPGAVK